MSPNTETLNHGAKIGVHVKMGFCQSQSPTLSASAEGNFQPHPTPLGSLSITRAASTVTHQILLAPRPSQWPLSSCAFQSLQSTAHCLPYLRVRLGSAGD